MLHIVLFEPEIIGNTGNIARTCVGFNASLHLIRPYGFFLNDKIIKRTSANHWQDLELIEHDCYEDFIKTIKPDANLYFYSRYGLKAPNQFKYDFKKDIYLIFGKESTGIPVEILKVHKDHVVRVPTSKQLRSMNLSNTVAIATYEVVRQDDYQGLESLEPFKPKL